MSINIVVGSNMTKQPKWHGLTWILCTFVQLAKAYEIIHECNDGHSCHESTIYGMVDEANPEMQMIINCSTPGSCTSLTVYSSITTVVHCSGLLSCQNAGSVCFCSHDRIASIFLCSFANDQSFILAISSSIYLKL